jgi:hypothetical protein
LRRSGCSGIVLRFERCAAPPAARVAMLSRLLRQRRRALRPLLHWPSQRWVADLLSALPLIRETASGTTASSPEHPRNCLDAPQHGRHNSRCAPAAHRLRTGDRRPRMPSARAQVAAKTGHTARLRNFPITGRSDRRNVSTSHHRSLRKLQFLHNRLEARLVAQGIH